MISLLFKCTVAFVLSFVVLSFQVNNKPIFNHLVDITGPIGSEVQSSIHKSVKRSYQKSKEIGTELFSNSDPRYTDEIKSRRSSTKFKKNHGMVLEELNQSDVKNLDKVIRDNK